jgi:serine/threonine-protein phosphatase 4 regulatory subunit 4
MDLLLDPVPNVRLCIARLLPSLKQTIRLPEDVDQLVRYACCTARGSHQ